MEHTEQVTVSIDDSNGDACFLVSDMTVDLLDASSRIRRASYVEPANLIARKAFYLLRSLFGEDSIVGNLTRKYPGRWRVNLSPVNGPILPATYSHRSCAIAAEVAWLERYFL